VAFEPSATATDAMQICELIVNVCGEGTRESTNLVDGEDVVQRDGVRMRARTPAEENTPKLALYCFNAMILSEACREWKSSPHSFDTDHHHDWPCND
jgi:hypothetical protein